MPAEKESHFEDSVDEIFLHSVTLPTCSMDAEENKDLQEEDHSSLGLHNYKRKREPYDPDAMKKAVCDVKSGVMGYKAAAIRYGLKKETIRGHVKMRHLKMGAGRPPMLSDDEEFEVANCLKLLSSWGFTFTQQQIQNIVAQFLKEVRHRNPFNAGRPGYDWLRGFFSRHPGITELVPEQLKKSRGAVSKEVIKVWFNFVEKILKENELFNKPERIYVVDESGFPLYLNETEMYENSSHLYSVCNFEQDAITVQSCVSGNGRILPPYIIYAADNLKLEWTLGGPDNSGFDVSEKGWIDSKVFCNWFKNHFLKCLPPERPIVLLYDGHPAHISIEIVQIAKVNSIIIVKMPPHILQPLDVGVYVPGKMYWEKILSNFTAQTSGSSFTKENFPSLIKELWETGITSNNIKEGFQTCGLFPFNKNAITESAYEATKHLLKKAASLKNSSDNTVPSTSNKNKPDTMKFLEEFMW